MPLRFRTKLTLVFVSLFLVAQSLIAVFIYNRGLGMVEQQVADQLGASARTFSRIVNERVAFLRSSSSVLAEDSSFKAAVATGDEPQMRRALQLFSARTAADIATVVDASGRILAKAGRSVIGRSDNIIPETLRLEAMRDRPAYSLVEVQDALFQLVVVPVYDQGPIAWLMLGVNVDLDTAVEIKQLSPIDLEIAFISRVQNQPWKLAVATTDESDIRSLLTMDSNIGLVPGRIYKAENASYFVWRQRLENIEAGVDMAALLYYPVEKAYDPYTQLGSSFVGSVLIGLIVLAVASYLVSRGITQPLIKLADAAKTIAAGDYDAVKRIYSRDVETRELAESFNQMVDAVSEREQRIVYTATHDNVTGLPNRLGFEEAMKPFLDRGRRFTILAAEITDASAVRTNLDFDRILFLFKAIATRLKEVTGDATISRLTNDIFYILLPAADEATESNLVQLITAEFQEPLDVGGIMVDVGFAYGCVRVPEHGREPADIFRKAGLAVYKARSNAQMLAVYDDTIDSSGEQSLSMMSDMRAALGTGEIKLFYQPKIDLRKGKVVGVEALIRWFSSKHGFVPPDTFIPLAERTGDITQVTQWALDQAIGQAAKWNRTGMRLKMSVNLSATDLMNPDLPSYVSKALVTHAVGSEQLVLEVTESAVMQDINRAIGTLKQLQRMGVTLSIDDYGTGYSSLSYLKRLPVRELKIDMSFIRKLATSEEDEILVRSTIDLGHNLGLAVTAEGVEDSKSVDILRDLECDLLQGYHFSKPVPAEEIVPFVLGFKLKSKSEALPETG